MSIEEQEEPYEYIEMGMRIILYDEIKSALYYDDKENEGVFIPNEVFDDFITINGRASAKSFSFSYYYLITYLYRFSKYGWRHYSVEDLKEILGYSRDNKTMNGHIKRNGTLSKMGYLSHTNNAPIDWNYDKFNGLSFCLWDDFINDNMDQMRHYRESIGVFKDRRNSVIGFPVKSFYRWNDSTDYDGTFYDVTESTMIPVTAFMLCMSLQDLGVEGFWLYSFIKYKSAYFGGKWSTARSKMANIVGIGETKLNQLLVCLEEHRMIDNNHQPYVMGVPEGYLLEACSYCDLDHRFFDYNGRSVSKRELMSFKRYCVLNGIDYEEEMNAGNYQQSEQVYFDNI